MWPMVDPLVQILRDTVAELLRARFRALFLRREPIRQAVPRDPALAPAFAALKAARLCAETSVGA